MVVSDLNLWEIKKVCFAMVGVDCFGHAPIALPDVTFYCNKMTQKILICHSLGLIDALYSKVKAKFCDQKTNSAEERAK